MKKIAFFMILTIGILSSGKSFALPAAVTGLTATPAVSGDINLTWTNPPADLSGVIVLAKTDSAPALVPVNGITYTVGSNYVVYVGSAATYADAPLVHNIHRYYKVFAYDALKNYSTAASVDATGSDSTRPAAVTGFTATTGDTKVTLGWGNPTTTDFTGVLVLYKQGSVPTGTPATGATYTVGYTIGGDAKVGYKGYATTTQITDLTNDIPYYFVIYAYDERPNYSTAASANAIPVPLGISTPAAAAVNVKVGQQVAFAATGPSGSFNWTTTGGTLSTATGANVTWTAPAAVATSPTAYTVTLTDGVTPMLTATRTINVYSGVSVTNKPTTTPTVLSGASSMAFTASGADTNYTWTIAGPVPITGGTGATYTFTAPTTGAFAGEYTITVADSLGLSTDSFKVKVPFTLAPDAKNILGSATLPLAVNGTVGTSYSWEIMDSITATTAVATPADYGMWTSATTTTAANTLTPKTGLTEIKTFYVRVTVAGDPDLTEANGLNKRVFGPYRIVPVADYTVEVKTGTTALSGASVTINIIGKAPVVTGADGKAIFTNIPFIGGEYLYTVSAPGYVTQTVSSTTKTVYVAMTTIGGTITGAVQDNTGAALVGATLTAYIPGDLTKQYTATSAAAGAYTINLPTGSATSGWTLVAAMTNYLSVAKTDVALTAGTVAVNFTGAADGLAAKGLGAPEVDAGGGVDTLTASGQTVNVYIPAGGVGATGFIQIVQAAKTDTSSNFTAGSKGYVYDVKVTSDLAGTSPLAGDDIKRIIIELPIDLSVVKPGDLENGFYMVYAASNLADLESGKGMAVPSANIISTDYVGDGILGSVTFWVDHLPGFFAVGKTADSIPVSISIVGQLVNAEGLASISGATVTITKGTDVLTTTTQADGKFSFINVPPGVYDIGFSSPDYWSPTGSVTVQEGISARWDIVAIPNDMISRIRSGYVTQEALDQAIASMFTKEQLDKAVAEERTKWDIGGDGKLGMAEVIYILQSITNSR